MGMREMASENPGRPNTETQPRRYWLVGLVLLGIVVAMLVGAFLLDKQFRPSVGVEAVPTAAQSGDALPTSSSNNTPAGTSVVAQPGTTATITPPASTLSVTQAVEQAYLQYWAVYSEALYTLDTNRLEEVTAGAELENARKQIDDLRSQNRAAKIDVQHNYVIVNAGPQNAGIQDRYLNKSVIVDAATKRPLQSAGGGETVEVVCQLELTDGKWKVVRVSQVKR